MDGQESDVVLLISNEINLGLGWNLKLLRGFLVLINRSKFKNYKLQDPQY